MTPTTSLKDKVPNRGLDGEEVLRIAVKEFEQMLRRDCMFLKTIAYRRVAFTLKGTFHFGSPHPPENIVESRVKRDGVVEGEVPLDPAPADGTLKSLERDVRLDNPNLDRIHHDMPIRFQRSQGPMPIVAENSLPGEPPQAILNPPQVENVELRYDKTGYDKPEPPVDRDVTAEEAARLDIKPRVGGLGLKPRDRKP